MKTIPTLIVMKSKRRKKEVLRGSMPVICALRKI